MREDRAEKSQLAKIGLSPPGCCMPSGRSQQGGPCWQPGTRRGWGGWEVRRRHDNRRTEAPGNFTPGPSPGSRSSVPALGRTSSSRPSPILCPPKGSVRASTNRDLPFWSLARRPCPRGSCCVGAAPSSRATSLGPRTPHRSPGGPPVEAPGRPSWLAPCSAPAAQPPPPEPSSPRRRGLRDEREAGASQILTRPPPLGPRLLPPLLCPVRLSKASELGTHAVSSNSRANVSVRMEVRWSVCVCFDRGNSQIFSSCLPCGERTVSLQGPCSLQDN